MQLIGYARVSTPDQSLERQLDELRAHGCSRVFAEAASGKRGAHRPEWDACLGHLRRGDALVVVELSRLGRNTGDLGRLLDHLDEHGIGLQILNLGIDTTTAAGRLVFTITGAVAAMERELLIERTQSVLPVPAASSTCRGARGVRG
jgi:DNA invertase Pin-like site-specific DNA recombinase